MLKEPPFTSYYKYALINYKLFNLLTYAIYIEKTVPNLSLPVNKYFNVFIIKQIIR